MVNALLRMYLELHPRTTAVLSYIHDNEDVYFNKMVKDLEGTVSRTTIKQTINELKKYGIITATGEIIYEDVKKNVEVLQFTDSFKKTGDYEDLLEWLAENGKTTEQE